MSVATNFLRWMGAGVVGKVTGGIVLSSCVTSLTVTARGVLVRARCLARGPAVAGWQKNVRKIFSKSCTFSERTWRHFPGVRLWRQGAIRLLCASNCLRTFSNVHAGLCFSYRLRRTLMRRCGCCSVGVLVVVAGVVGTPLVFADGKVAEGVVVFLVVNSFCKMFIICFVILFSCPSLTRWR